MSINWQAMVAALDAAPKISTKEGADVLSALVFAGREYDQAGKPDVLHESSDHQQWVAKRASEKLGIKEPPFYEPAFYVRPFAARGLNSGKWRALMLTRDPKMPESAPASAKSSWAWFHERNAPVAKRIAQYYIAKARDAELALLPLGPTNGAIQQQLLASISAAEDFLNG